MRIPQFEEQSVEIQEPTAYADITVILDRSASMVAIQQGMVEAYNDYIRRMHETPGDSKWTMIQFDDHASARGAGEIFPHVAYQEKSEKDVPYLTICPPLLQHLSVSGRSPLHWPEPEASPPVLPTDAPVETYLPRGGTALIDAMCKTIDMTMARLSGKQDYVKPVVMVITDGAENSSKEHTSEMLRERIAKTQGMNWQYLYLGANQDSFAEATRYGIDTGSLWHYAGDTPALSGGLAGGSSTTNNFEFSRHGTYQGIASGMIGLACVVSGSITRGKLIKEEHHKYEYSYEK